MSNDLYTVSPSNLTSGHVYVMVYHKTLTIEQTRELANLLLTMAAKVEEIQAGSLPPTPKWTVLYYSTDSRGYEFFDDHGLAMARYKVLSDLGKVPTCRPYFDPNDRPYWLRKLLENTK